MPHNKPDSPTTDPAPLPRWYDAAAVERFCYALLEAVAADLPAGPGAVVTGLVTVHDDGAALLVLLAGAEQEPDAPIALGQRWLNLRTQGAAEIQREVAALAAEAQANLAAWRRSAARAPLPAAVL